MRIKKFNENIDFGGEEEWEEIPERNYAKPYLIPCIDASDLPDDVEQEFDDYEISTHYQNDVVGLDWDDDDYFSAFKSWLLQLYGEEIKKYSSFAIFAT